MEESLKSDISACRMDLAVDEINLPRIEELIFRGQALLTNPGPPPMMVNILHEFNDLATLLEKREMTRATSHPSLYLKLKLLALGLFQASSPDDPQLFLGLLTDVNTLAVTYHERAEMSSPDCPFRMSISEV